MKRLVAAVLVPFVAANVLACALHAAAQEVAPWSVKPGAPAVPGVAALRSADARAERVYFDEVDGVVWARSATYKASFGAEGATYIPYLGSRAPRNFPLALSPASATRGGVELDFAHAPVAVRLDSRVELDRGAFVEAYELATDSVEQLFVFDALGGDGDLALTIPVESDMSPRASAEGLEFENEHGRVVYGRAVAIDAAGRRADAPTELVDGTIVIRVDDAFLDVATFPLTIDPLITNVVVDSTGSNDLEADVAYDLTAGRWLVVYERVFSDTDHDVFSRAFSADGLNELASGYVDTTTADWRAPRCADNNLGNTWLVVGQRNGTVVMGRIVHAATHVMDGQFTIAVDAVMPDVGGDRHPFGIPGSVYVVVYTRMTTDVNWDIVVRGVSPMGSVGPEIPISESAAFERAPSISKSSEGLWMIVWLRDSPTGTSSVYGAILHINASIDGPTLLAGPGMLSFPEASTVMTMASAPFTVRFLVTYQKQVSPGDNDVLMLLIENGVAVAHLNLGEMENQGVPDTSDQLSPSVECDDDHFVVVYCDEFSTSGTDYDVYAQDLYVSGSTLGLVGNRTTLAFSITAELFPRVATRFGAGETDPALGRQSFVVWDDNRNSNNGNIEGAIFATVPGGTHNANCVGDGSGDPCPCGNNGAPGHGCGHSFSAAGALLAGSGAVSTVQDTFRLDASNLPPVSNQVTFFQGTSGVSPVTFGDGLRCALGTIIRIAAVPSSNGNAACGFGVPGSVSISVRGAIPAGGATRHYQATYRNSAVFCTSATFNVTNGIRAIWAP